MLPLLFLLFMLTSINAGSVTVNYGRMVIEGYDECNVTINNGDKIYTQLEGDEYIHDGVVFGLVKWWCDFEYGSLIKNIECKDCGIYCNYNQQFEICRTASPLVIGIVLGAIIFLLLLALIIIAFKEKISHIINVIISYFLMRDDRNRAAKVKRLNEITGIMNPIKFRIIETGSEEVDTIIMKRRLILRKELTGDEPLYGQICDKKDGNDDIEYMMVLEDRVTNNSHNMMGRLPMPLPEPDHEELGMRTYTKKPKVSIYTTSIMVLCLLSIASACDKTLYLSTQGKICDKSSCVEMNTYQLSIKNGQVVCFNTPEGNTLRLFLRNTNVIVRYQASYYTCDYAIETQSTYRCKVAWGDCYNGGTCYQGYAHEDLKMESKNPHGYGCTDGVIGCDTHCTAQVSCTWYRWELVTDMAKCFRVYNKISEIWETDVVIDYDGVRKVTTLSTNNPTCNMNSLNVTGLLELPMAITSLLHETVHVKNSLLLVGNIAHEVDASQINMPVKNTIEEHQLSLDKLSTTFYTSRPEVMALTCSAVALYDEPALMRLLKTKQPLIKESNLRRSGDYVLKRNIPINGLAKIMIGSMRFDHLFVSPSYCKIKIEQSYGCIGCNIKPYVIFRSYDIKSEGSLEYETNCTWSQQLLSCSPDPYMMTLDDYSDICTIHIPSTNQTLTISFDFIFVGEVSMLRTYFSESSIDALKGMATDQSFWFGLMSSLNLFAVTSVILTVGMRALKLGLIYKTNNNVESA